MDGWSEPVRRSMEANLGKRRDGESKEGKREDVIRSGEAKKKRSFCLRHGWTKMEAYVLAVLQISRR